MSRYIENHYHKIFAAFSFLLISSNNSVLAADGEALFKTVCQLSQTDADYTVWPWKVGKTGNRKGWIMAGCQSRRNQRSAYAKALKDKWNLPWWLRIR